MRLRTMAVLPNVDCGVAKAQPFGRPVQRAGAALWGWLGLLGLVRVIRVFRVIRVVRSGDCGWMV